jgi:hypothetical protein|tara:strand:+ start:233 stop:856 length:624 start_codon:yes stop_codon:yes gene_type:complete
MALVKYNNNSISGITSAPNVGSGDITLIKTLTASSDTTLSFVHGSSDVVLDDTYPIYMFKFININAGTDDSRLQLDGSTNSGSSYGVTKTTTAFQVSHGEDDSYTAAAYVTSSDLAQSGNDQRIVNQGMTNDADGNACGEMFLFNPYSNEFVKNFIIRTIQNDRNPGANESFFSGYFNTTSAINAIQFVQSSGNFDGTIKLYGIKDS